MSKENLFKKIKRKIKNKIRRKYIKQTIGDIGKITETDNGIICNVEQKMLDNLKQTSDILIIDIDNQPTTTYPKLNKPVYFIFEGITFTTRILINSKHVSIAFKNCTFTRKINIYEAKEIIFDDNKYIINDNTYPYSGSYIDITPNETIKKITFKNEKYIDTSWKSNINYEAKKGQYLNANIIEITNSNFTSDDPSSIYIEAEKLVINNSNIYVKELYLNSKSITLTNSNVTALNGAIIENQSNDFEGSIQSNEIIYNGISIPSKKTMKEKKQKRLCLIEQLNCIKNQCNNLNNIKLEKLKNKLDNQKIKQIIK